MYREKPPAGWEGKGEPVFSRLRLYFWLFGKGAPLRKISDFFVFSIKKGDAAAPPLYRCCSFRFGSCGSVSCSASDESVEA